MFRPVLLKFSMRDIDIKLLLDSAYRDGWQSENHNFIKRVDEFLSAIFTFKNWFRWNSA
jgi:hypothetical protein